MSSTIPRPLRHVHVLDGDLIRKPVDMDELNRLCTVANNRIGQTTLGYTEVSTDFTPLPFPNGMWFETMIFGGDFDGLVWRYVTRAEAEAGHDRIVAALTAGEDLAEVTL